MPVLESKDWFGIPRFIRDAISSPSRGKKPSASTVASNVFRFRKWFQTQGLRSGRRLNLDLGNESVNKGNKKIQGVTARVRREPRLPTISPCIY